MHSFILLFFIEIRNSFVLQSESGSSFHYHHYIEKNVKVKYVENGVGLSALVSDGSMTFKLT